MHPVVGRLVLPFVGPEGYCPWMGSGIHTMKCSELIISDVVKQPQVERLDRNMHVGGITCAGLVEVH